MDIKSLIAKMDEIESKQEITESQETTTEKEIISESVDVVENKKESIASVLLRDMGYEFVNEEEQPGFLDRVKGSIKSAQADRANFEKELAASNEPGAAERAKENLTPSQLKWLGGADAADPYIRARMPKPQPGELTIAQQKAKDKEAAMDKELDSASAEMDKLRAAQAAKIPTSQSATPAAGNDELKKSEIAKAKEALNKLKAAIFQKNQKDPLKKDAATAGALANPAGPVAKENMSESEIIAKLRQQLEAIESRQDQEVDEIAGALRGIANVGKNFMSGLKGGGTVQQVGKAGQFGKIAPGGRAAQKVGAAMKANPGKTAVGAAAAGGAAGYALSGGEKPTAQSATPEPTAAAAPAAAAPAAGGKKGDPEVAKLQKELNDKYNAGLTVDGIMGPKTKAAQEKFMGGGQSSTPAAGGSINDLAMTVQSYRDSLSTMAGDPEVDALLKDIDKALQDAK